MITEVRIGMGECGMPQFGIAGASVEGTVWESPARKCRVGGQIDSSPEGTARLSKRLLRIKCYPRFSDHRLELDLIRPFLMVLGLMLNVMRHQRLVRTAYAESSVSLLPI